MDLKYVFYYLVGLLFVYVYGMYVIILKILILNYVIDFIILLVVLY